MTSFAATSVNLKAFAVSQKHGARHISCEEVIQMAAKNKDVSAGDESKRNHTVAAKNVGSTT
jgi:hypothetical protein